MTEITVLTASLPTRPGCLLEASRSVTEQTLRPVAHLIAVDHARRGSAHVRNQLARAADTDWLAILDDDDVLYPQHLATLAAHADHADLVYSFCDVTGHGVDVAGWSPNRLFDDAALREGNYIPATVLLRAAVFHELGGFNPSSEVQHGWEDWNLWLRILDAGGRVVCAPKVTWRYRLHPGSKTFRGEDAAF